MLQDRRAHGNLASHLPAAARTAEDGVSRPAAPLSIIPEFDCALVLARGRRIAVLTEPLADSSVLVRVAPTLRALGSGAASAAGAVILLGPGSATFDLSFLTCRGGAEARAGTAIDDLAVAAALAARLGGRVLDEPALLVAALPGPVLLRLVPPRRWWRGTWLVRDRDATVRIPARLLLYGGLVLG